MGKISKAASSVWRFYRDSFREMTWGRPLVWLILLKLFIIFAVLRVFFLAGFNGTAYYPSFSDLQSSLTIRNSSSSYFTLKVMSWVSLLIPFVVAYIAYAWHQMDRKKITPEEIEGKDIKY